MMIKTVPFGEEIGAFLSLLKLRIGVAMVLTALASMAITPGMAPSLGEIGLLCVMVILSAGAAGGFNHYYDYDIDRTMVRTRNRPFVTGQLTHSPWWLVVLGLILLVSVAVTAWVINGPAAVHLFLGAFFYGVVYTVWLKRRTWLNIVIGGLAGSFAVLTGAASVDSVVSPLPLSFALILFLWTPSHFWSLAIALREEYALACIPMLPVVAGERFSARVVLGNSLLLVAASVVPWLVGLQWIYLFGMVVSGGYFLYCSVRLAMNPVRAQAMANFRASLIHLGVLLLCAVVDTKLLGST